MGNDVLIVIKSEEIDFILNKYSNYLKETPDNILLSNIKDIIISLGVEDVRTTMSYKDTCVDLLQYIIFNTIQKGIKLLPNCNIVYLTVKKFTDYFYITINKEEKRSNVLY